jgi:hypothetical protein
LPDRIDETRHLLRVIAEVGIEEDRDVDGIDAQVLDAPRTGAPVPASMLEQERRPQPPRHLRSAIGAAVVDDDHLQCQVSGDRPQDER